MNGIPVKYILKYNTASSIISSGVFIIVNNGLATDIPANSKNIPLINAIDIVVCTASCIFSLAPTPIKLAIKTLAPIDKPTNKFTNKFIAAPLLPTAAIA